MIKKLTVLIALILLVLFAYNTLWFGEATIKNIEKYETIELDGHTYAAKAANGKFKLRPGTYKLIAFEQLRKNVEKEIKVSPFSKSQVELPLDNQIGEADLVKKVLGSTLSDGYRISNYKLFENNSWLVVFIESVDFTREGSANIYKFDGKNWAIVEGGTGLGTEAYVENRFPPSVVSFLEMSQ